MHLCASPCLGAPHHEPPCPAAELLFCLLPGFPPVFSSSPSSGHQFPMLISQLCLQRFHSEKSPAAQKGEGWERWTHCRLSQALYLSCDVVWGDGGVQTLQRNIAAVEENTSEVGGSRSCIGSLWRGPREEVLKKEGSVPAYGDLSGVVFVITGSFIALFTEWGLHAFSGLGNQWYFGFHFTSCCFLS